MPIDLKFCFCVWSLFCRCNSALGRLKRVGYSRLLCFFHFRLADQAKSQHILNPGAREFRPSHEASEGFQRNSSNRYALYFIRLRTMNVKYLKKTEVLYVIGDLVLWVEKEFLSEIHRTLWRHNQWRGLLTWPFSLECLHVNQNKRCSFS